MILLTLAVPARAVAGGITLNWGGCVGAGAHPMETFSCANPNVVSNLVLELQPPPLTGAFSVDVVIDLQVDTPGLAGFWHLESGACNETGLSVSPNRSTIPNTGCLSTFTGSTGAGVTSLITAVGTGFGGANRVRVLVAIARSASSPVNLSRTGNYYLSHLTFSFDNASQSGGACSGCTDRVSAVWSSATIYTLTGSPTLIDNSGLASNCVTINGVGVSCGTVPSPVRSGGSTERRE